MSEEEHLTFRDRVKLACLQRCIDAGLTEEEMVHVLNEATHWIRSGQVKNASARWLGPAATSLGYLSLLGVPAAALSTAALGNIAGRTARNVQVGRLPTAEEIKLLDEIATYHRTADEIKARTEENEEERKRRTKPSVRRIL